MTERSTVDFGHTRIPFDVRRSPRRKTVALAVDAFGGLTVTAPPSVPLKRLDDVVRAKVPWIVERRKRASDLPPPLPAREFTSGETFLYLGRQLRLRVTEEALPAPIRFRGRWLELPVPRGLDRVHHPSYARAALTDWYRRLAASQLPRRIDAWASKLGVDVEQVLITEQAKRWGSCSGGLLRLNWRVVQAPIALVDYVLAHEVVHLQHEHHGPEFWATLGRVMPDYERRKARLRELGATLVW